jgi:hypothetical protein
VLINRIEGATRYLGAPLGWEPEKDGNCAHLAIADVKDAHGANVMVSSWQPTPAELEAINRGEPIHLYVWGVGHPPVAVGVRGAP